MRNPSDLMERERAFEETYRGHGAVIVKTARSGDCCHLKTTRRGSRCMTVSVNGTGAGGGKRRWITGQGFRNLYRYRGKHDTHRHDQDHPCPMLMSSCQTGSSDLYRCSVRSDRHPCASAWAANFSGTSGVAEVPDMKEEIFPVCPARQAIRDAKTAVTITTTE